MAKRNVRKNPWIAAILNIIIAGLGYIYVGRRKTFGYLLVAGTLITAVGGAIEGFSLGSAFGTAPEANLSSLALLIIGGIILEIAFAYDAYRLAQGRE
ncbi:MAG: hypothetical protein HYW25_05500 [Candidatus Aenigmarchaeota archaeon]|nr:hypothetical protein [Candidatus Aenigmarchaeota archaeon]